MTTSTLEMPRLSGGPDRARAMVDHVAKGLTSLAGRTIVLDCRPLLAGGISFAMELVQALFVDYELGHLDVQDAPPGFRDAILDAAARLGVQDRVHILDAHQHNA